MALHRFKLVEDDVSHWEGTELVLSYMDSARLLQLWNKSPEGTNTPEGYEAWIREKMKDAPRR